MIELILYLYNIRKLVITNVIYIYIAYMYDINNIVSSMFGIEMTLVFFFEIES